MVAYRLYEESLIQELLLDRRGAAPLPRGPAGRQTGGVFGEPVDVDFVVEDLPARAPGGRPVLDLKERGAI